MAYRIFLLLIACCFLPSLIPEPATAIELWRRQQRRPQVYTTPSHIDNPEEPIENSIIDYVWGDNAEQAAKRCRNIAANHGLTYLKVKRTSQRGTKWECHVLNNHPEPTIDDRSR